MSNTVIQLASFTHNFPYVYKWGRCKIYPGQPPTWEFFPDDTTCNSVAKNIVWLLPPSFFIGGKGKDYVYVRRSTGIDTFSSDTGKHVTVGSCEKTLCNSEQYFNSFFHWAEGEKLEKYMLIYGVSIDDITYLKYYTVLHRDSNIRGSVLMKKMWRKGS